MKQFFLLLAATVSTTIALAQNEAPYINKSLANEGINKVIAETSGGNILVNGVSAEPHLELYLRSSNGRNSLSQGELEQKFKEDYDLTLTTANHTLTVICKPKGGLLKNNWNSRVSVSFKIYVPVSSATNVKTSGGNVDMAHLSGVQEFRTSGGNLHIDDLKGNIKGVTSGGNVHVINCSNDIDLRTSGGNIEARNNDGKISLHTSGGNVTLSDLKGNVDATTSGGNVTGTTISGELLASTSGGNVTLQGLACSLDASTSGGHLSVSIKELGSYVKLANSGGNVNLTLPANKGIDIHIKSDKISLVTPVAFTGTNEDGRMEGKFNGGGVPVTVRAGGSRVSLTMK
jgi:DUF4097 and DUF4098 domain-containing protein YvlB